MNKKLWAAGILFFLILSMGFPAFKKIEHLVWADTGLDKWVPLTIKGSSAKTVINTPTFLTFHVPPSPGTEALFFDCWSQLLFWWSNYSLHRAEISIQYTLKSSVIPSHVIVLTLFRLIESNDTNRGQDSTTDENRHARALKLILRGDQIDWWFVRDKISGQLLPPAQALPILKSLIKNGFDVEVNAVGELQGVKQARLYPVFIEVTRLGL